MWLQASVQTMSQHMELMRKVETVNLLQESNKLLREENTRKQSLQQEMEAKVGLTSCFCDWIERGEEVEKKNVIE